MFVACDFEYVPPAWPEKPRKQQKQMHLNFGVDNLPSVLEESINHGATKAAAQMKRDTGSVLHNCYLPVCAGIAMCLRFYLEYLQKAMYNDTILYDEIGGQQMAFFYNKF